MELFDWIERELRPAERTTDRFIYDDMESQSGASLPVLYQPFDAARKGHWSDRGLILDFLLSTEGEGRRLLDFGPGDGWPSLGVAPFAREVVGVDASTKRVEVCAENARRLGIGNAEFVRVPADSPLPFEEASFDGVMAASSIEQTPDPQAAIQELHRVLRPGGRLRVHYEALGRYRGGREREAMILGIAADRSRILLYDRDLERERVRQYALTYARPRGLLVESLTAGGGAFSLEHLTIARLTALRDSLIDAAVCETRHPSATTLASWLREAGFRQVLPTHDGGRYAGALFQHLEEHERPADLPGVDALLRPGVRVVTSLEAPWSSDPMITAVK